MDSISTGAASANSSSSGFILSPSARHTLSAQVSPVTSRVRLLGGHLGDGETAGPGPTGAYALELQPLGFVTLGKFLNFSEPLSLHLYEGLITSVK